MSQPSLLPPNGPVAAEASGRAPDLAQFRAFDAIHRLGSLTAAAEALGLTQPALSKSLSLLRRYYGEELFTRSKQGMRPTPLARRLAPGIRQLLQLVDEDLRATAGFDPASSTRVFKLSCTEVGAVHFMPRLLAEVGGLAPGVRWDVLPLPADGGVSGLAHGEIDLVFAPARQSGPGVMMRPLYEVGYRCLVRPGHPRIKTSLSLAEFCAERHVVAALADSYHGYGMVEKNIIQLAGEGAIGLRLPSLLSAPFIVAQSDMVFTASSQVAARMAQGAGLRLLACPLPLEPMQVCMYWHQRFAEDPSLGWLRALVLRCFGPDGGED